MNQNKLFLITLIFNKYSHIRIVVNIPKMENTFLNTFFWGGCQGARNNQVAVLDLPQPWLFNSQLLFTYINLSESGADCYHVTRASGLQKLDNEELIFCRNRMYYIYVCHNLYRFCFYFSFDNVSSVSFFLLNFFYWDIGAL